MMNNLLLAFYGDDFTGSTDALEFVSRAGMKAALFIEPPTPEMLASYPGLTAVGVAGITRALSPQALEEVLVPAFKQLYQAGARHIHYKVCSTFDSSPTVGSIGRAIDAGAKVFQNRFIPLLVAAPSLGRYCVFGNLFARMGISSAGNIFRLDRHPSMSMHPVTPADESDLRLHLGKQTAKAVGLLDILHITKSYEEIAEELDKLVSDGVEVVLMDALYEEQLSRIGELIDREANRQVPLFSVGSSGVEMALGKYWNAQHLIHPVSSWPCPGKAAPLLVLSGSCSPVTAGQIQRAVANGFKEIKVDANLISGNSNCIDILEEYISGAVGLLQQEYSVIIHTGGNNKEQLIAGKILGTALGTIGRSICAQVKIKRMVVAGGDTSSYAARVLGIEAVEMIAPLVPGAPLCKAHAPNSPVHGLEVNFKGGQVGNDTYFEILQEGKIVQ